MRRKTIFILFALVILTGIAGVWLFLAETSPEALRERLEAMTGAQVQLASVERLWWGPGAELNDLELKAASYDLEVERLEVRVAFLPLLWGQVTPRSVDVQGARLHLHEGENQLTLPALPWEAAWTLESLTVLAPVGGQEKQIFHVGRGSLATGPVGPTQLEISGGATADEPLSVQVHGEASNWQPDALPQASLALNLENLPAQPIVGWLTGDPRILATARLDGLLTLTTEGQTLIADGRLRAAGKSDELLALQFRAQATRTQVTLQSATGTVAGNRVVASGAGQLENGAWSVEADAELPEGRLDNNTLRLLHEAMGREVLGFADHLRGPFTGKMKLTASPENETAAGTVTLGGMSYTAPGLPAVRDLRGELEIDGRRVRFTRVRGTVLQVPLTIGGEVRGKELALRLASGDIGLAELPLPAEATVPATNLQGTATLRVAVDGTMDNPAVAGEITLADAGFDFRGVAVRAVEGKADFTLHQAEFQDIQGQAGACGFTASGRLGIPAWHESAVVDATVQHCPLAELLRLAEQAELGPIPLLKPGEMDGTGDLTIHYADRQWDAALDIENGRWGPAWLALPVEGIEARLEADPQEIVVQRLNGQVGKSPVSVGGRIDLEPASPAWELALRTALEPVDAEQILHGRGPEWFRFPGAIDGEASLTGSVAGGVRVQAKFEVLPGPENGTEDSGNSGNNSDPVTPTVTLAGLWQDGTFAVEDLTATVGSTQVKGRGRLRLPPDTHLELNVQVPAGSSARELLAFVRLPELLRSMEGTLGADVNVAGTPGELDWSGHVDLEEIHIPELLTEPVSLKGRINVVNEGLQLEGVEVRQPLGTFMLTGLVRPHARSELQLRGAWANLDRLLGQLPESQAGRVTVPQRETLARYPARVTMDIEQVQFLGVVFKDVSGELEQEGGELTLRVPRFGLGAGHGSIEVKPQPGTDQANIHLTLAEVPMTMLLADVLKQTPAIGGPLQLEARLTGPLSGKEEFLREADGRLDFQIGQGRFQRGTLPERLFALAVLLKEGVYGFGLKRLARIGKPYDLDRFREWNGTIEIGDGKAQVVESHLVSKVYDLHLTGTMALDTTQIKIHGDGNFHPGWEFDISLKAVVGIFERLLQLARRRRGHEFEFDVSGTVGGRKSVENFKFKN